MTTWNWSDGVSLGTAGLETITMSGTGPTTQYSTILADTQYFVTKPVIVKADTAITAGQILIHDGNAATAVLIPAANTITLGTTLVAGVALQSVAAGSTAAVTIVGLIEGQVKASALVFADGTTDSEKAKFVHALQQSGIVVVNDY